MWAHRRGATRLLRATVAQAAASPETDVKATRCSRSTAVRSARRPLHPTARRSASEPLETRLGEPKGVDIGEGERGRGLPAPTIAGTKSGTLALGGDASDESGDGDRDRHLRVTLGATRREGAELHCSRAAAVLSSDNTEATARAISSGSERAAAVTSTESMLLRPASSASTAGRPPVPAPTRRSSPLERRTPLVRSPSLARSGAEATAKADWAAAALAASHRPSRACHGARTVDHTTRESMTAATRPSPVGAWQPDASATNAAAGGGASLSASALAGPGETWHATAHTRGQAVAADRPPGHPPAQRDGTATGKARGATPAVAPTGSPSAAAAVVAPVVCSSAATCDAWSAGAPDHHCGECGGTAGGRARAASRRRVASTHAGLPWRSTSPPGDEGSDPGDAASAIGSLPEQVGWPKKAATSASSESRSSHPSTSVTPPPSPPTPLRPLPLTPQLPPPAIAATRCTVSVRSASRCRTATHTGPIVHRSGTCTTWEQRKKATSTVDKKEEQPASPTGKTTARTKPRPAGQCDGRDQQLLRAVECGAPPSRRKMDRSPTTPPVYGTTTPSTPSEDQDTHAGGTRPPRVELGARHHKHGARRRYHLPAAATPSPTVSTPRGPSDTAPEPVCVRGRRRWWGDGPTADGWPRYRDQARRGGRSATAPHTKTQPGRRAAPPAPAPPDQQTPPLGGMRESDSAAGLWTGESRAERWPPDWFGRPRAAADLVSVRAPPVAAGGVSLATGAAGRPGPRWPGGRFQGRQAAATHHAAGTGGDLAPSKKPLQNAACEMNEPSLGR